MEAIKVTDFGSDILAMIDDTVSAQKESDKISQDYKALSADKVWEIFTGFVSEFNKAMGTNIKTSTDGVLSSFNSNGLTGFTLEKDGKYAGTIRYFNDEGNILFGKDKFNYKKLGRITSNGVVRIVKSNPDKPAPATLADRPL